MAVAFETERLTIRELPDDDLWQSFDVCAAGWGQASA
jgi:hypothetical protein